MAFADRLLETWTEMMMADEASKDAITVLLAEYASLRSEINARVTTGYQIYGVVVVALTWVLSRWSTPSFWFFLAAVVILAALVGSNILTDMWRAVARVEQLEAEVNRRLGVSLLEWETYYGGTRSGPWALAWRFAVWTGMWNAEAALKHKAFRPLPPVE
jgi:predicted lysophospholipase L1 biosynthesis ABC-type transport system permease subunit